MSNQFIREDRYIVFKLSDVERYLTAADRSLLAMMKNEIDAGRDCANKPPFKGLIVESDWPEYEPTWRAIEARVTGAQTQPAPSVPTALLVAVANLVAQMEIVSRVGFVDTPNDKDSCAAFCVAEGTWLELMSAVESLASALAAAGKAAKRHSAHPAPSISPAALRPVIQWLRNGCDPARAADELEMLASAPEAKP